MHLVPRFSCLASWTALLVGLGASSVACSIYEDNPDTRQDGGSTAGAGGSAPTGSGGTSNAGGSSGSAGLAGSGGFGSDDASTADAPRADADASPIDVSRDARIDLAVDTTNANDAGTTATADVSDTAVDVPPGDAPSDVADAIDESVVIDVTLPPNDVVDAPSVDADAAAPDAGRADADGGILGPETLPKHGSPIEKRDAGAPFDSRCANDEVVTGFVGRAGVQTDAIAATCSKLIGGVLSSPHNLPLNGYATGGNAVTVACPANYVAVGIVGRYGHNTMWNEDVTTSIGVICKDLASTTTQTVSITSQPALDPGYISFQETCTQGRYLTSITGTPDSNSLGYCVQQFGGECNVR